MRDVEEAIEEQEDDLQGMTEDQLVKFLAWGYSFTAFVFWIMG